MQVMHHCLVKLNNVHCKKFYTLAYLFKDSLIEKLLQFLIAVINAELLKAVHLKILYNVMTNNYIQVSVR